MKSTKLRSARIFLQNSVNDIRSSDSSFDKLLVDGEIGIRSKLATAELDGIQSSLLNALCYMEYKMSYHDIEIGSSGFRTPGYRYLSIADAERIAQRVGKAVNETDMVSALKFFMNKEAVKVKVTVGSKPVLAYDVLSTNGSSRGLLQFQPAAWADARKELLSARGEDIGDYKENVYNPVYNMMACIGYMQRNERSLAKLGYSSSVDNLYLAHNQGMGLFLNGRAVNINGQSSDVQVMINRFLSSWSPNQRVQKETSQFEEVLDFFRK